MQSTEIIMDGSDSSGVILINSMMTTNKSSAENTDVNYKLKNTLVNNDNQIEKKQMNNKLVDNINEYESYKQRSMYADNMIEKKEKDLMKIKEQLKIHQINNNDAEMLKACVVGLEQEKIELNLELTEAYKKINELQQENIKYKAKLQSIN
jgi:hypothetical protein